MVGQSRAIRPSRRVAASRWGCDPKVPRKLEDVLDYFLPGAGAPEPRTHASARAAEAPRGANHAHSAWRHGASPGPRTRAERPAALPIIALPIGDRDFVHAAFAWNLVVEIARLGAAASLLAPADPAAASLWPASDQEPIGARLELVHAANLRELNRAALDSAVSRAADAGNGGVILARVPPAWLDGAAEGRALLRWVLLFAAAASEDLRETYGLAKRVLRSGPRPRIGITIHGVRRIEEAEHAFARLANTTQRHLGHRIVSYGLLVDDLHIYRAITAHRPIGLEHPQCRAARALRDVARLLLDDAQDCALG